ncbi:MAG: OmpH family outer membrane protein [Rikenellaceae bacterium]|nr:OmpH family outer membrane protein [Rikenellaceae bacterium]
MKKIFVFALAAACALTACNNAPATQAAAEGEKAVIGGSDIAYVSVEQVIAESDLMQSEGQALADKTQKAQESWAKKEQSLAAEAAQLQQKYEKGLITTRDAQTKQESIQKRATSFQNNAQKEAQTLDEENRVFTNRMQDLVMRAVQEINAEKQYKMIVNANSLLDADTTLNITPAVLEKVNELYAAEKESK